MSNFNFFNKLSPSLKTTLYIIVGIIVIVGLLILVRRSNKSSSQKYSLSQPLVNYNAFEMFNEEDIENFAKEQSKTKIVLVYANWCPYCEEYLSTKARNSDKNAFDTAAEQFEHIVFEKLDAAENQNNQQIANSYGVQGYPTIVAARFDESKNTYVKVGTFEGDRSNVDELVAFAQEYSS
jgi:thiol-disulfide isomerase/thioredoxin